MPTQKLAACHTVHEARLEADAFTKNATNQNTITINSAITYGKA